MVKFMHCMYPGIFAEYQNNHLQQDIFPSLFETEENCGRCLPGWILLKSSCYYFSPRVSDSKKNWPDSRADCISHGGDLLVINNLEEQVGNLFFFPSEPTRVYRKYVETLFMSDLQ